MEFKEILRRRRSVRKYLSRPVEREVLDTVLREALAAPSSRNSHSTHLRVLTDPETIARIARMRDYGSAFLEHAPAVVLVEGDRTATDLWRENAAITATALLFAATDAGLASCWVHVNGRPCLKDRPTERRRKTICGSSFPSRRSTASCAPSLWVTPTSSLRPCPRSMRERISTGRKSSGAESSSGRASVGKDLVRSFYVVCRYLYREPGWIRLSWAEFIFFAAKIRFVE